MAGAWAKTNEPCVYVQAFVREDLRTGRRIEHKRYKAAFRAISNGKPVVTSRTFDRKADAVAFVANSRTNTREGAAVVDLSKSKKTVTDAWEHLVSTWRKKPSTLASYEARWSKHIGPALGDRRLSQVQRSELEDFYADVEKRTSLDTRRKVQQIVHKVFAVALRSGWTLRNPADAIEMPGAVVKREPQALTEDQVAKVASEVPERYHALVWTLAETGMRVGEAVALSVRNLNGTIRVVENAPEIAGRREVGTPKTEGSERNVPISPKLRAILAEHLNLYANRFDPDSLVFTGERGAPVSQANFRKRVFQPAAVRVGLDPVPTVHDLRHTGISLWLQRGLTPFEVAKMVGHTDLRMIEKRYGHLYVDALQKKIDALGES
jgi:integrase